MKAGTGTSLSLTEHRPWAAAGVEEGAFLRPVRDTCPPGAASLGPGALVGCGFLPRWGVLPGPAREQARTAAAAGVGSVFPPPGELGCDQIHRAELLRAAGQRRNILDLVTFFFGLPRAVEGLTRVPFQNRRDSLLFGAANKEKNEASWSPSPGAPPGGAFLQAPGVLPVPAAANFPPRGGGACPSRPTPRSQAWRPAGEHTCAGDPAPAFLTEAGLGVSRRRQVAGVAEPQGPVLAGVAGSPCRTRRSALPCSPGACLRLYS